jgi:hypothetical protein
MNPTAGDLKTQAEARATLPLWRWIAGLAVFACFLGVIAALAPVYVENLRLGSYIRSLAAAPSAAATPDETLRSEILERASRLGLPVQPSDVQITHKGGKIELQVKYRVQTDLALYPVDLHFHPGAASR